MEICWQWVFAASQLAHITVYAVKLFAFFNFWNLQDNKEIQDKSESNPTIESTTASEQVWETLLLFNAMLAGQGVSSSLWWRTNARNVSF